MINIAMWGKALKVIPRISKEEWNHLDVISRWLIASRSAVFVMTALSAGIGGLLTFRNGLFSPGMFLLALTGLVLAHATNNLINDYVDYRKGIDHNNYYRAQYGPQALEHGLLSPRQFLNYILVSGLLATAIGLYLVIHSGTPAVMFMLAGLFFLLFYTWPLKYYGLGEPSVVLVWGPLMIGGTYLVVSGGHWDWSIILISLVYALGPTSVLLGKHIDKLKEDKARGVRTLPVITGEKSARYLTISLLILQYLLVGMMVITGKTGAAVLIVLLALPKLFQTIRIFSRPRPSEEPNDIPKGSWPLYLVSYAFLYNRQFGSLFLLGLILDVILFRAGIQF
ncbi:MAG: prenyltransferase [Bacteroidales bacterium]|nr:prenyltransferase [Bacteroidales bacterium]